MHTHYDHCLDTAVVAERTGAVIVGGTSAANIGRGHGLEEDRLLVATPGERMSFGNYDIALITAAHCPPDRYPGRIDAPVTPPVRTAAYRCGDAWALLVAHRPTGQSALIMGSAGYVEGALAGQHADVAYLGVGQLGIQSEEYIETYWTQTVRTVGARRVVLVHWDDFFRPLTEPLRALPYAADDLDRSWRLLRSLADSDGVALHFPTLFTRENPWE